MTTVNWERLAGEVVEELASVLIVRANPNGNRITPSRGDRGVDIRVWNGSTSEIYQIKRYSRPLTSKQAGDVEKSWNAFVSRVLPESDVSAWHLVMPWDPTHERWEWLCRLTASSGVDVHWIGRTHLDFLAANNPQVVDYFQGDGAARIEHLLAQALAVSSPRPDQQSGDELLEAIVERHAALQSSLDEVDPFYRYEIDVRHGPMPTDMQDSQLRQERSALVVYREISDQHHLVMRIVPRDSLAAFFRPITQKYSFDVSDPADRRMVEDFFRFGAPITQVPAVTLESEGPPGSTAPIGSTAMTSIAALTRDDFPELELRLRDSDGNVMHVLPLNPAEVSTGLDGHGLRIAVSDTSDSLSVEFRLSTDPAIPSQISLRTSTISGKPARRVLAVADFVADIKAPHRLELAIAGGLPLSTDWEVNTVPVEGRKEWADVIHDLAEIQAHTHVVVVVPQVLSTDKVEEIRQIARILRGEVLPYGPARVKLTLLPDVEVDPAPVAVQFVQPINLSLDGQAIPLDRRVLVYSPRARIEANAQDGNGQREAYVAFETPGIMQAIGAPVRAITQ